MTTIDYIILRQMESTIRAQWFSSVNSIEIKAGPLLTGYRPIIRDNTLTGTYFDLMLEQDNIWQKGKYQLVSVDTLSLVSLYTNSKDTGFSLNFDQSNLVLVSILSKDTINDR